VREGLLKHPDYTHRPLDTSWSVIASGQPISRWTLCSLSARLSRCGELSLRGHVKVHGVGI